MKISLLSHSVVLLNIMLNLFCISNFKGQELCWCDSMKYTFSIIMCPDTCELICFKLDMMLNTTELLFGSSLNDIEVDSRSQGYGKTELVQSFCCKVMWNNSNVHDGGLNSSLAVCWAHCRAWCSIVGSSLLLGDFFSSIGDFSLRVNMGSISIPPKLFQFTV